MGWHLKRREDDGDNYGDSVARARALSIRMKSVTTESLHWKGRRKQGTLIFQCFSRFLQYARAILSLLRTATAYILYMCVHAKVIDSNCWLPRGHTFEFVAVRPYLVILARYGITGT